MASPKPSLSELQAQLEDIYRRHAALYEGLTDEFGRQLDRIIAWTLAALMEKLRTSLKVSRGTIERSPENLVILTKLDTEFQKLVRKYGYKRAINAFVGHFSEQFSLLRDTFAVLSYALEKPDLRQGKLLLAPDLKVLHAQQMSTIDVLNDVPVQTGIRIKQKAMQGLGASNLADMQQMLHKAFDRGTSDAVALGSTAMSTFYRIAESRIYDRIQAEQKAPLRYSYAGPLDKLNRAKCRQLETQSRKGRTWTRAEIDRMDNSMYGGAGPGSALYMAMGINCRHQFVISLHQNG
jgi:hypothetical protein